MTEPPTERRWRAFADVVAVALGTNVWVSMVVLPALFVGALRSTGVVLTLLLAPAVLLTGVWRRSELMLLGVFPTAVLVPIALRPEMAASHVYGPLRFVIERPPSRIASSYNPDFNSSSVNCSPLGEQTPITHHRISSLTRSPFSTRRTSSVAVSTLMM